VNPRFLADVRVLEVGDGVAGAAGAGVLQLLGADVTAVVDVASVHRQGSPSVDGQSLLSVVLDRGKQLRPVAELDLAGLERLTADFDVVLVDRVAGPTGPLAELPEADRYAEWVLRVNRGAWVTVSAFGLTGNRRDDVASDLTVAAASGMLQAVRNPNTGFPLKLAGQQALLHAGQAAALAACHALDLVRHEGPAHLDLSAVEAMIATGPPLELAPRLLATGGRGGAKRYGAPAGFYPCLDGLVRISAMEDHQWQGMVEALESPAWAERFDTVAARIDGEDEIDSRVGEWTATRTKFECETVLQAHGVPATGTYSPVEILESPQLRHRGALSPLPLPGGREATIVGSRHRTIGEGTEARPRSLRGLKVLEMSHVLAGPLAGAVLGALGADVVKLEDLGRIDMYRRRGPYIDGEAGGERSAYFALMNHSKRSVAFDVVAEPDRLEDLLDDTDVVIENLGGRRAARIGLAASVLAERRPEILAVSSSGFGQDGPHASYRAYAYNLQAACGLGYLTRDRDGTTAQLDVPVADLISAYALATLVAAWAVGPRGNAGAAIDFAMADLVISHFNEFVAAASLDPDSDAAVDRANDLAPFAPHGVYPSEDGWIAIAVSDADGLARLADAVDDERLNAAAGDRRLLDQLVAATTVTRAAATLAAELRAHGITAEEVVEPAQLLEVDQLASRGFFTPVEHPEWGRRRIVGIPWRSYGDPAIPLTAAPRLQTTPTESPFR
jgi:crotonobetainyl-CoA:carnitine CoA-transferase CaiB-like acyl-CoA transferase